MWKTVFLARCAAKAWVLSLRASEVKYWTHLSTSDWGKDASSCRSSSSADNPWRNERISPNNKESPNLYM